MSTTVTKWGNSLGLRIPRALARQVDIDEGSDVEITVAKGRLVIEPRQRRSYSLKDLLAGVTSRNRHDGVDAVSPVGREML